jgi:hypothetical protein
MDELPFRLAFVMVKESFAVPAILFYLAAMLRLGLTWRNPVRVASPHRINLEEPGQGGQPT